MNEEWKIIPNFPNYRISNRGAIQSCQYGNWRTLKTTKNKDGYCVVGCSNNGSRKQFKVHRLVLELFVGYSPTKKHMGAHLNGIRHDNRIENLMWATCKENTSHRKGHGTWPSGTNNGRAKLNPDSVKQLRKMRDAGYTWRLVAAKFGMSISGAFAAYHVHWRETHGTSDR